MQSKRNPMNSLERRAVGGLAGIFALRMMGLFLILPVFALYAEGLRGHTALLVGLALGVYGLTQAVFQIPLGKLSDRIGRKPVIAGGLLLFAVGSVVAALSDTMLGVIIGRALQGAGAIAAAVLALAADLTRDEQRTKAMAIIGVSIGTSFILSMVLGSVLNESIGVPGIFWLTAALALGGIAVLMFWVPTPATPGRLPATSATPVQFREVLRNPRLLRLDIGIFILHCVLTALFVVVPLALVKHAGLASSGHWAVYVPVMLLSAVFMIPLIILAERKGLMRQIFAGTVLLLAVAQLVMWQGYQSLAGLVTGLFLFFLAFNFLEAALPSLVSRAAPLASKGTAIGVYTTFEFLGAFAGGAAGGWLYGEFGIGAVFIFSAVLLLLWFALALNTPAATHLTTRTVNVGPQAPAEAQMMAQRLGAVPGVAEAVVMAEEGVAYLKVDAGRLDQEALERCLAAG